MANKKKRSLFSRLRDNLMSEEGLKSLTNFIGAIGEYKKGQDTKDTKAFPESKKANSFEVNPKVSEAANSSKPKQNEDISKLFKKNKSKFDLGGFGSLGRNYTGSPAFKNKLFK